MTDTFEAIALDDAALATVTGGGLKNALALGATGAVSGAAYGGVLGGPVGGLIGGVLAGAGSFVAGAFIPDSKGNPSGFGRVVVGS